MTWMSYQVVREPFGGKQINNFIQNVVKNDKNVKENFVDCPKLLSLVNSEKCFTPSLKLI